MKHSLVRKGCLLICAAGVLTCTPKKPPTAKESSALCRHDSDCVMPRADGSQRQGVCIAGTCQECVADEHCPQGEVCNEGQCTPPAEECGADADCESGSVCAAGRCRQLCEVAEDGVDPCSEGRVCAPQGFCVEPALICNRDEDCEEGGTCEAGLCVFKSQPMAGAEDPLAKDSVVEEKEALGAEFSDRQRTWTVWFGFDQSVLRDQDLFALRQVVQSLKKDPESTVVIEGHADNRGAPDYNLALSERRAGSVERYLQRLGIAGKRMRKVPYGSERPADSRDSEEAWAKNRRCEIVVQSSAESPALAGEQSSRTQPPLSESTPPELEADF
ncbi:MAG: OmpA family protein [Myxococcota bacterium]